MREPYIIIDGATGDISKRGGGNPEIGDTQDSGAPDQGNTPMPDLQEHDFEPERRRSEIEVILNIDPNWLRN